MCDDPKLQNSATSQLTFPPHADLIPAVSPLKCTLIGQKELTCNGLIVALQNLVPEQLATFSVGGYCEKLSSEQATQLSDTSDLLIFADHLITWQQTHLFEKLNCPLMIADQSLVYHPYQGALRHTLKQLGYTVMSAEDPTRIVTSLTALQARKWIASSTLLMVCDPNDPHPMRSGIQTRADALHKLTGARVIVIPVDRIKIMASQVTDNLAGQVWDQWKQTLVSEIDPTLTKEHLLDVARLYVAMRQLIDEHDANAMAVQEFEPFLFQGLAMPNVAYAALRAQGITTAEEGDLTMLITQMLMAAVNQQQAMMVNFYLGYRDAWEANKDHGSYSPEAIAADYHQAVSESTATLCHFGTAGTVPPNMTDNEKYDVVQTRPSWVGQSMTLAFPKLGEVACARLDEQSHELHVYPGKVTRVFNDPQGGWYRARWYVKLDDMQHFVDQSFSAHYALAYDTNIPALTSLCDLLNMKMCLHEG